MAAPPRTLAGDTAQKKKSNLINLTFWSIAFVVALALGIWQAFQ